MDCPSCGAVEQHKARCEACGFAFPQDSGGGDDVLSLFLGLVCPSCDGYNDPGTTTCTSCGAMLTAADSDLSGPVPVAPAAFANIPAPSPILAPTPPPLASPLAAAPPSWMTPPTGSPLATAQAMKAVDLASITAGAAPAGLAAPIPTPAPQAPQAAPAVDVPAACWRCKAALEGGDKFCRSCGARTDQAPVPSSPVVSTVGVVGAAATNLTAATQVMSALKLPPTAPPPVTQGSSSTMVIPAMRSAQEQGQVLARAPTSPQTSSTATMVFGAVNVERSARLILVRGSSQTGSQWPLRGDTVLGRSATEAGAVLFPDDLSVAPRHARLTWRGPVLMLEPESTTNGVYLRIKAPVRLQPGDEFLVGAQRLRVLQDDDRPQRMSSTADTKLLGSVVKPHAAIALARVTTDEAYHEVYFRPQRLLTIGRAHCDVTFPSDGFVSERHVQLTNEGNGVLTLEDLGSRNGTYVRCRTATALAHGDLLLIGDQVLRVEVPR